MSNTNDKLADTQEEARKTSTALRNSVKGKFDPIFRFIPLIVIIGIAINFWVDFKSGNESGNDNQQVVRETSVHPSGSAVAVQPVAQQPGKIIPTAFVIPAQSEIRIPKEHRCYVDTRGSTNPRPEGITRNNGVSEVIYTSTLDTDVEEWIWFYDEGGDCNQDLAKLKEAKAFL